jgi:hypothetical protein
LSKGGKSCQKMSKSCRNVGITLSKNCHHLSSCHHVINKVQVGPKMIPRPKAKNTICTLKIHADLHASQRCAAQIDHGFSLHIQSAFKCSRRYCTFNLHIEMASVIDPKNSSKRTQKSSRSRSLAVASVIWR